LWLCSPLSRHPHWELLTFQPGSSSGRSGPSVFQWTESLWRRTPPPWPRECGLRPTQKDRERHSLGRFWGWTLRKKSCFTFTSPKCHITSHRRRISFLSTSSIEVQKCVTISTLDQQTAEVAAENRNKKKVWSDMVAQSSILFWKSSLKVYQYWLSI